MGQPLVRLLAERELGCFRAGASFPEGPVAGLPSAPAYPCRGARSRAPRPRVASEGRALRNCAGAVAALPQFTRARARDLPGRHRGAPYAPRMGAAGRREAFRLRSSGGVYGQSARLSVAENERFTVAPTLGFCLCSKLCAEFIFQNYRHFFDSAMILHRFFTRGRGQRREILVPRLIESVRSGQAIKRQGPDGLRPKPVYVDDAVEAFAAALDAPGRYAPNFAGPDVVILRAVVDEIGAIIAKVPKIETAVGAPSDYVGDTALARSLIGASRVGFADGIVRTVQGE